MTIKIEEGKSYRTRDGQKFGPIKFGAYPNLCGAEGGSLSEYYIDKASKWSDGRKASHDLVAEWVEPIKVEAGKFYRVENGDKVGPMERYCSNAFREPATGKYAGFLWCEDGLRFYKDNRNEGTNLVAEWVNAPAFKVGDRVQHYISGNLGTISRLPTATEACYIVDFDGSGGKGCHQAEYTLRAALSAPKRVVIGEEVHHHDPVTADLLAALKLFASWHPAPPFAHQRAVEAVENAEGRGVRAQSFAERERDLLAANNRLLERARKAEAERDDARRVAGEARRERDALRHEIRVAIGDLPF